MHVEGSELKGQEEATRGQGRRQWQQRRAEAGDELLAQARLPGLGGALAGTLRPGYLQPSQPEPGWRREGGEGGEEGANLFHCKHIQGGVGKRRWKPEA